jgi:hypothetical protein
VNPKDLGERTEAVVIAELVKLGFHVLLPFGDNRRYDVVLEHHGRFIRLQCKTGRLRRGRIEFRTASTVYQPEGATKRFRPYHGEADAFVVYCWETDAVYVVPIDEVGSWNCFLRVDAASNGQVRNVRLAADHVLTAASFDGLVAPGEGLEPSTNGLTVRRSAN